MLWSLTCFCTAMSLVLVVCAWFRLVNSHAVRLCKAIPSAQRSRLVFGNALSFLCSQEQMTLNLFKTLDGAVLKGHRAVCFWFGPYPLVFVADPDDVKKVLNNSLSRGKVFEESIQEYSRYGLLSSPLDHWRISRRQLNPLFHPRNLEQLLPTMNTSGRRLVADLATRVDGPCFDLLPCVMLAALRTISAFLFGPRAVELISTEQLEELRHGVVLLAEMKTLRVFRPWLRIGFVFKLLYGKEIDRLRSTNLTVLKILNAIEADKNLFVKKKASSKAARGPLSRGFQNVIDAMRELQERVLSVSDEHVTGEMLSFFAAGTDTIGAAVSSCLLALARYEKVQYRVYEEICSIVAADGEILHTDFERLVYLDHVINETLRFFSVVPFTSREPSEDLDLGGYTLPANKLTVLWLASVSFDPKYFPDPHVFDPDRFSRAGDSEGGIFLPFSKGPRNCIGKTYAMMLVKVMVVHVLRKYKLSTNMDVTNLKKKFMTTMTSCDGYKVVLSER